MEKTGAPVNYPLIITLEIDAEHKAMFNDLRRVHFPAHANYLEAHLTLFHHLPSREPAIGAALQQLSARSAMLLDVTGIKSIGNGVIYTLASDELQELHEQMQQLFAPWLKRQDQQTLRPHITIQNKVTAFKASRLTEELSATFIPFAITATGFSTWYYLGGPWRPAAYFPFM
jgi:2'-5' RNA ligase